jgi:hypothetical protein
MYGTMYGTMSKRQKKTTIYLPEKLKAKIEDAAAESGVSEATVIRDAIYEVLEKRVPEPRIPLGNFTLGRPDVAERANELLDGFGE